MGGPALAGILVALAGPGTVIALDAASYAVSVLALASLRLPAAARPAVTRAGGAQPGPARLPATRTLVARSYLDDLREGWAEFRGRAWLVITTVQFTLFNLLTWGPFLLLGPVLCRDYLGGAGAWGAVMACYGGGSVLGALLALGRAPRRPMIAATVATFVAAYVLPAGVLARVTAFQTVTAFAFGPLAFAAAGPVAAVLGARAVLGFGAAWATLSCAVVLALPAVRAVSAPPPQTPRTPGPAG